MPRQRLLPLLPSLLLLAACAPAALPSPTPTATATAAPTPTPPPTPTPKPELGTTRVDAHGIAQVWVPPGVFEMGTRDELKIKAPDWAQRAIESEKPAHEVEITTGFWLDQYEVTNAAFAAFVEAGGYRDPAWWSEAGLKWLEGQRVDRLPVVCRNPQPDQPRVCITWFEAEAYARWRGGRLPTEAQWEYAARGPESLIYPWGNTYDETRLNLFGSLGLKPVGSYPEGASWVGAYDMAGNAMEWVQDWWSLTNHQTSPRQDPTGPESGSRKIEKGGWWGGLPFVARAAYRHFEDPPGYQDHHIGFRIITQP